MRISHIVLFLAGMGTAALAIFALSSEALKRRVRDIPTQQTMAITGVALVYASAVVYFVAIFSHIAVPADTWDGWLLFLFAIMANNAAYFGIKRATAWKPPATDAEQETGDPIRPPSAPEPPAPNVPPALPAWAEAVNREARRRAEARMRDDPAPIATESPVRPDPAPGAPVPLPDPRTAPGGVVRPVGQSATAPTAPTDPPAPTIPGIADILARRPAAQPED